MKILFYGGCHASALRSIFKSYSDDVERADNLTNFQLIAKKMPFPYEKINQYDWVVFSPILNKGDYNTNNLEAYCKANGVKFLKYPWLQWGGYFPGSSKTNPSWYGGWWNQALTTLASQHKTFESFKDEVFEGKVLGDLALNGLERTTERLRSSESHGEVKVTDYILDNYRKTRLFLTPDHASTVLYQHIARQVSEATGAKLDPAFYWRRQELQYGIQLPILPSVGKALGLEFVDGDFQDEMSFGARFFSLTEYLKMFYFEQDIRLARPKFLTRLRAAGDEGAVSKAKQVTDKERFLVRLIRGGGVGSRNRMDVLGRRIGGDNIPRSVDGSSLYFQPHWTMSRSRKPVVDPTDQVALPAA